MVKLKDISICSLYEVLQEKIRLNDYFSPVAQKLYDSLVRYSVTDYQMLKELIESKNPEFNNNYFKNELRDKEMIVADAKKLGHEKEIYLTNNYGSSSIDRKVLDMTDYEVGCENLIINDPLCRFSIKTYRILPYTVGEAKYLLSRVTSNSSFYPGENAFRASLRGYGFKEIAKLQNAINFYEEQVLRQYEETTDETANLFFYNYDSKRKIVEDELKQIVEYLTDSASSCVWGSLSDRKKQLLISSIINNKKIDRQIRENFINMISNYTTLSELEKGIVRTRKIDRFIVKKD